MDNSFYENQTPLVTKDILKNNYLSNDPFFLVDVGASGGIEKPWHHFGDNLKAIAIDPLINECERLQKKESRPLVRYMDAFITAEKSEDQLKSLSEEMCLFYQRSSSEDSKKKKSYNFIKENFNSGADLIYSDKKISLNTLLKDDFDKVNFLKVDTDGFDICVLKGANKVLNSTNLIGAMVECQFIGSKGTNSNVFSNIERLLAEFGFYVFNMDINKHSRHHLPSKFRHNLYGQTIKGQTTWADVLFMKDPLTAELTKELAYKYLMIYELFNLQDCAAELLVERSHLFSDEIKSKYLDLLALQYYNGKNSYEIALKKYRENPEFYFPENYYFGIKKIQKKVWRIISPYFPRSLKDIIKACLGYGR